jgi:serine protease Do
MTARRPMLALAVPGLLLVSGRALADDARSRDAALSRRTPVVEAVERVGPAVVNIATEKIVERSLSPWFFWEPQYMRALSLGSGVIIDPLGYVITNAHVITRANQIQVHLRDGKRLTATPVAVDVAEDAALLKLDGRERFPYVQMGRSDDLLIGETVIALGNPFGLENSVSSGVVSAKNRSIEADGRPVFQDLIQTDASINPGNSGGPLLNINGEVIGLNTAVRQGAQGIGFAIPIDRVYESLLRATIPDRISHIGYGMRLRRPPRDVEALAVVAGLDPRGQAARGGVREGDRILSVSGGDGRLEARSALAINLWLVERRKDERVRLRVWRDGETLDLSLTSGRSPGPAWFRLGIDFGEEADDRNVPPRIQALERNGPAEEASLQEGDVLFSFGGVEATTARRVEELLGQVESGKAILLGIRRRRRLYQTQVVVR